MSNRYELAEATVPPPSAAAQDGHSAFDAGWSRFSNPHPAGSRESDDWAGAWAEAQAHVEAQASLDAGADPEDYK